jgi:hypothetical protein
MRYRLRTLLIVLALGPVALAGAWGGCSKWQQWRVQQEFERALREWEDTQKASPDEN